VGRVRIGTCSGPADAALVRAAFEAHGIPLLINAEQHASMLGGLGGAFVPLHIFVDGERAEEASALLADLREHDRAPQTEDLPEEDDESAEDRAHDLERSARRRRSGIILMIVLAGAVATPYVIGNPRLSVLLVASCLVAMFLALRQPRREPQLPRARLRR
jgi:hypothetical protein